MTATVDPGTTDGSTCTVVPRAVTAPELQRPASRLASTSASDWSSGTSLAVTVLARLERSLAWMNGSTSVGTLDVLAARPCAVTACLVCGHQPCTTGSAGCRALARTVNAVSVGSSPKPREATGCASVGAASTSVDSSTHQSLPVRSAISVRKPKSVSDCIR
ncbi:MAG: hypothetical protein U0R72_13365 [Nakamurella multipartita]